MQDTLTPTGWLKLRDVPPGTVFETQDGARGVKSELCYDNTDDAQAECIGLADGKYLHFEGGNDAMVKRCQAVPLTLSELTTEGAEVVVETRCRDAVAELAMRLIYLLDSNRATNGVAYTFGDEQTGRFEVTCRRAGAKDTATIILELQEDNAAMRAIVDNLSLTPSAKREKAKKAAAA